VNGQSSLFSYSYPAKTHSAANRTMAGATFFISDSVYKPSFLQAKASLQRDTGKRQLTHRIQFTHDTFFSDLVLLFLLIAFLFVALLFRFFWLMARRSIFYSR
jgi:hypothetical protein